MEESTILVAHEHETGFVRVLGKGSFKNAKLIKSFAESSRNLGVIRFVIDLQQCKHMDSTFMGVLAGLASQQKKAELEAPKCVNLSARNRELLETLGLDKVMNLVTRSDESTDSDFELLDNLEQEDDKKDSAQTMLEAHENLIDADVRNAAKFQDVVKFLRHKLDS
ncbi:MAG: STAS domain-containing protein [Verrucomicrobiota bacterium]